MERETFWRLVEQKRTVAGSDDARFLSEVRSFLDGVSKDDIVGFHRALQTLMGESYRSELWAAAYIINGGCSDDGFDYFRAWLIAQGPSVYERALADPATLEDAIVMDGGWDAELEEFLYLPRQVYSERFHDDMPEGEVPEWELTGPEWDEDSVRDMYPRLFERAEARFGHE